VSDAGTGPPQLDPGAVRGVVFDLDGTLIDSYRAIAASVNYARRAFELEPLPLETVRSTVGRGLECLLADVLGPDRVDEGVRLFRRRYAEVFLERTTLLDGVRETLDVLVGRGLRLAVASNKPARFSRPILEHLGLGGFVTSVHGPDTVGATKPDPAMLRRSMSDLGITPGQALYVGDMLLDVASASAAGVPVALVVGGSAGETELRSSGHPVLPTLPALCDLLCDHRTQSPESSS
jgi:phosphoglycolate phosphatase